MEYIIDLFLIIKDVLLMAVFIFIVSSLKLNWKQITKYVVINTIFFFFLNYCYVIKQNQLLYLLISQLTLLGVQYLTIKQSLKKTLLSWSLTSFITLVLQFVPFIIIDNLGLKFGNEYGTGVFGSLLHAISFIILILIIYKLKLIILPKSFDKIENNKITSMIVSLILTIILIAVNAYFSFKIANANSLSLLISNFVLSTILFIVNTYNTSKNCHLILKEQELEYQRMYNETLNDLVNRLRVFKHDYANVLNCIKGYIDLKNLEGLNNYFNDVLKDYFELSNLSVLADLTQENPAIYSLISAKFYSAEANKVNINLSATTNLNNSCIKVYEFSKILGILLDNAIEEAKNTDEKIIDIKISEDEKDNNYCVRIENSTVNDVDIHKIFEKDFSSKGDGRGLGLWEVRNILNKYDNASLITNYKNNRFSQELYMEKI